VTEDKVEQALVKKIKGLGGLALKFVSQGRRGVNDRLVLLPVPEEYQELVAKYIYFAELKRPRKKPTVQQARFHITLKRLGFKSVVIDKKE
jgi:hypothetical protein